MMKYTNRAPMHKRRIREAGNIFFMLFASIAVIGAMTAGAGNIVKGIVTSMSDVTRKTITEEKMQAGARISIQASASCDADTPTDLMEPLPFRTAGTKPHPVGGGLLPEDIGATLKDPWGTEYGYCAWNPGNGACADPNYLAGSSDASDTVVAVISAGKDRKFSTTCNPGNFTPADCTGKGANHYNDPVSGHCYFRSTATANGNDANNACAADGAHLATITSAAEQTAVQNLTTTAFTWIGANDAAADGTWLWSHGPDAGTQFWAGGIAGSPVGGNYTNWVAGEPNGGAGEAYGAIHINGFGAGQWVDEAIWNWYTSICEIEPTQSESVTKTTGSDDIVMEYSYNDANGMSGNDLWKINDTKPGSAKIDKDIDVAGGARLSGPLNLMRSGLILPGDADTGACDVTTDQQIRINFTMNPATLEICDFAAPGSGNWETVSMGGGSGGWTPPAGIVSWWKMDETTGSTVEDFIGSNDGSWQPSGNVVSVAGHVDTALNMDATNSINVPNDASLQSAQYTVSLWVNPDTSSNSGSVQKILDKGENYSINWSHNSITPFSCEHSESAGSTWIPTPAASPPVSGTWSHIVCSYDGTTIKMYVNGALVSSALATPPTLSASSLRIGSYAGGSAAFPGALDDVMIFNRALSPSEIEGIFYATGGAEAGNRPSIPGGYVGYWKFDEGAGSSAADSSANNLTGTIDGATWVAGKNGGALQFDGTNDNVDLGTPALLNMGAPTTVGAWVNLSSWGASGAYFYTDWAASKGIKLGGNGSIKVTNDTHSANGGAIAFNTWHHVTVTVDSSKSKIYVDGQLVSEGTGGLTAPSPAAKVFIGGVAAPYTVAATSGMMDDVIVYNRALDATEVQKLYQAVGGTVADQPLITGNLLVDQGADQCASAGTGPLIKVGTSDTSAAYYGLANADSYLLAVGSNGLSVFSKGNGSLTRLGFGGPAAAGFNSWLITGATGIYVSGTNYHWVTAANQYAVSTFDGVNTVSTNTAASGLTVKTVTGDGRFIYVVGSDGIKAYTNNGSSPGTVAGTYSGSNINNAWSDGNFIYVVRSNGLLILKFDGSTFTTVTGTVPDSITDETGFYDSTGDGRNIYLVSDKRVIAFTFDGTTLTELPDYFEFLFTGITGTVSTDGANIYASNGESFMPFKWGTSGFMPSGGGGNHGYYVTDMKSDGGYLYVASPINRYSGLPTTIDVYSGVGCNVGNNFTAATSIKQAGGSYSGKITTGDNTSCGIKADGSAWCWGSDSWGRLGNGPVLTADQDIPSRVQDSGAYAKLVSSEGGKIGLKTDGTLWNWGYSYDGVLGQGGGPPSSDVPRKVGGNIKYVDVDAHQRGACGISTQGDAYCWGINQYGRLGNGTTGSATATPTLVSGGIKWTSISVSNYASCGIDTNAQLWCWGQGDRLGTGDTADKNVPTLVADPGPWRKVEMNNNAACALKQDGSRWCWGYHFRALGLGNSNPTMWQKIPGRTTYAGPWVDLSNNGRCATHIDGTVWCSPDLYGPTGFLAPLADPGPWAAMAENGAATTNCGIKTDGSFWCWGYDTNGALGNGPVETGQQTNPNVVWNMPGAQTWSYDDTGLSISATGSQNIAMGTASTIGHKASGPIHNCAGLGNGTYYNDPATGHCYFYAATAQAGGAASETCAKDGGYLASINSQREQNIIASTFTLSAWIDGNDSTTEGSWFFTGGELAGNKFWNGNQTGNPQNGLYNNWASGEPSDSATNKDCTLKPGGAGAWLASNCGTAQVVICEVGTAGARGGLSFPSGQERLFRQYSSSSELSLVATAANTSSQMAWKTVTAANTRTMGLDYLTGAFSMELNTGSVNAWLHDATYSSQLFINTDGRVGVGVASGTLYNKLTLGGGLKVGNDTSNCHAMRAGTLRYVGGSKPYKYCDGATWVDF